MSTHAPQKNNHTDERHAADEQVEKYLTFKIENELYGIPILRAQEIIGLQRIVAVPKAPDTIRGVINLRGRVIPVVDLRRKFDLPAADDTDRTCIIIINAMKDGRKHVFGMVVDEVSEVKEIAEGSIQEAHYAKNEAGQEMFDKVARLDDRVVMLLDITAVLFAEELEAASRASREIDDLEQDS